MKDYSQDYSRDSLFTVVGFLKGEGRHQLAQFIEGLWSNWQEAEKLLARERRDNSDLVVELAKARSRAQTLQDVLEMTTSHPKHPSGVWADGREDPE